MSLVDRLNFEQPDGEYEGDFPTLNIDYEYDGPPMSEEEETDGTIGRYRIEEENDRGPVKPSNGSAKIFAPWNNRRRSQPQEVERAPEVTTTVHESEGLSLSLLGSERLVVKADGVPTATFAVRKASNGRAMSDLWAATADLLGHLRLRVALEGKVADGSKEVSVQAIKSMLSIAALESPRFSVVTGELCYNDEVGERLSMGWSGKIGLVLQVEKRDRLVSVIPVNIKQNDRTHYLQATRSKVITDPVLGPLVGERIRDTKSNSVAIHDLIAIAGDGADLTLQDGKSGTHHRNLNGGDNRLNNLFVLSTGVHDEVHRAIDADPIGFENALRSGDDLAFFSDDLYDRIWSDHESFTGSPLPSVDKDAEGSAEGNALVEERMESGAEGETQVGESDYNPHGSVLTDISLSFDKGYMIASSTFPESHPVLDDEGKEKKDEWGRIVYTTKYRPRTVSSAAHDVDAKDPLPAEWGAVKPFALDTIDGLPRWSGEDMNRFVKGVAPSPDLAKRVIKLIDERIAFPNSAFPFLIAAYIAMTYVFPLARRLPILAFHSMGPGMGKSTALELISKLVFNGIASGVTSLAAIVRLADQARCTLVLDEQEKLSSYKKDDNMIEVMNSRTDAGAVSTVAAGESVKRYTLFGPTVIANLKGLSPTLQSRSIVIGLQPIGPEDPRKNVPLAIAPLLTQAIRGELMLWARANWKDIKATMEMDPDVRIGNNRQADLWRLLLAVTKHFGDKTMFENLRTEAIAQSKESPRDEQLDAVVLALAKVITEKSWDGSNDQIIFPLSYLHTNAQAIMEEDQRKTLHSRRVAQYCRSLQLVVKKHHSCGNSNAVFVSDPSKALKLLKKNFPELLG